MLDPKFVTVLEGDILKPNLGLFGQELEILHRRVNIVVHSASSISLVHPLNKLSKSIIGASESLANLGVEFQHLERFIYVSSAYSNSHLAQAHGKGDTCVDEKIYNLSKSSKDVNNEWQEVQKTGSSIEYRSHNFPWAYGYAKHLTERLLYDIFANANLSGRLFLLRPSIIGPAQAHPYPGFSLPLSTPMTLFQAATALTPSFQIRVATKYDIPEKEGTNDQVPVDVVVDRLLVHLACGTSGPVHAVSGGLARQTLAAAWRDACRVRNYPWTPRPKWVMDDWHSSNLHPIARFYVILGTSYLFIEGKTTDLWNDCSDEELRDMELFTRSPDLPQDLSLKKHHIWYCMNRFGGKKLVTRVITKLLYRSYRLEDPKRDILQALSN